MHMALTLATSNVETILYFI